jgi:hypothetical protein
VTTTVAADERAPEPSRGIGTEATPEKVAAAAARLGPVDALVAGILEIAGARSLSLDALLRLTSIEWSGAVTTAMVECADRPRLFINPVFVECSCNTPEKLATLLLHELSHVSMGHTKLFPRPTIAHNIAFDAVINRELLATMEGACANVRAMAALFIDEYDADQAPWFLLRPPPGWPDAPDWDASKECPAVLRRIHRRLYANPHAHRSGPVTDDERDTRHEVMYNEIVAALNGAAGPCEYGAGSEILPRLLGGHGSTDAERRMLSGGRDAFAAGVLAGILGPLSGHQPGTGGDLLTIQLAKAERRAALERCLRALFVRAFQPGGAIPNSLVLHDRISRSVDPSRDRRAPTRMALARAFGAPQPLFFNTAMVDWQAVSRDALVYLDASGSMDEILPVLHAALVPLRRALRPRIHAFSTEVRPVDDFAFDRGQLPTTGGTSITPALKHMLDQARQRHVRSALVITDGYFDMPGKQLANRIIEAGIRVHLAVGGTGSMHEGARWVASATRLPSL